MEIIPSHQFLEFHPNTLEDIRKCWNLDGERMVQSLANLKEWISKQNHFVNKNFNEHYLELALVANKGSLEKTKTQIDKLCTMKTLLPKFFFVGNVKEELADIADIVWLMPMPRLTHDHYRVVVSKFNAKHFTASNFIQYYQHNIALCEYLKAHDYINGYILITDFRDIYLRDILTKANLVEMQQAMTIMIEGYGARYRSIHMITESKTIELLIKTIKPMIGAKIGDRIFVHRDTDGLNSIIDPETLPVEYGGRERSIEKLHCEWLDIISSKESQKFLTVMKAFCTKESLRTSAKFNEQIMGLPGSFRTLHID